LTAARQFFDREGHLKVPRKHIETISGPGPGEERPLKLGAWVANQRTRAAALTPERVEQLSAVGMRWT
ncbi:helicase associated domain-containing protein, partial [Streptomyces sp. Root55]|uniref:helicase associated domain-containing protein n=1 Tax=Streptomyces sp. Root55 TaxID=1736554 RepID=UPI000B1EE5D2